MTGGKLGLSEAVRSLQKAAEAEFDGNTYYRVANQISELTEVLKDLPPAGENIAAGDFASQLADLRRAVESHLSGNQYYLAACRIDVLASFVVPSSKETAPVVSAAPAPVAPEPAQASQPAAPVAQAAAPSPDTSGLAETAAGPTFAGLAAASKARVEEAAASFVTAEAPQHVAPVAAEAPVIHVSVPEVADPASESKAFVEEAAASFATAEAPQHVAPVAAEAPVIHVSEPEVPFAESCRRLQSARRRSSCELCHGRGPAVCCSCRRGGASDPCRRAGGAACRSRRCLHGACGGRRSQLCGKWRSTRDRAGTCGSPGNPLRWRVRKA